MIFNLHAARVLMVGAVVIAALGVASGLRERSSAKVEQGRLQRLSPEQKAAEERAAAAALQLKANGYFLDACREKIPQQLHDPASAQWLDSSSSTVEQRGNAYSGKVRLRAKNAFGALRIASYDCVGALGKDGFVVFVVNSPD